MKSSWPFVVAYVVVASSPHTKLGWACNQVAWKALRTRSWAVLQVTTLLLYQTSRLQAPNSVRATCAPSFNWASSTWVG